MPEAKCVLAILQGNCILCILTRLLTQCFLFRLDFCYGSSRISRISRISRFEVKLETDLLFKLLQFGKRFFLHLAIPTKSNGERGGNVASLLIVFNPELVVALWRIVPINVFT